MTRRSAIRALRLITAVVGGSTLVACGGSHTANPSATAAVTSAPVVASAAGSAGAALASALHPAVDSAANSPGGSADAALAATSTSPSPTSPPSVSLSPSVSPSPSGTSSATGAPAQPLLVEQLASVGDAQQVIIVTAANSTTSNATLQTFQKDTTGWHAVFPAMAAHIGRNGFSDDKHEGDLKTPSGKYAFGTMFGQHASPGVKFPYRVADSQSVWVDQPSSPFYNTWQENAALSGEHLASTDFATSYAYAIDIAYNAHPVVAGKGSAIFLHVSTGSGTAGCVSIAEPDLLQVLRWLDPARAPVIVMGPTSVIRTF